MSVAETVVPESGCWTRLDRTLSYRLHRLHKISDLVSERAYHDEIGVSLGEGRCLAAIGSDGPVSVNDLARAANLHKAQASRAAQALVGQGLVAKSCNAEDGRGVALALTAAGREVWVRTMALIERRNQEIFGGLSQQEQQQLGVLLDRLIASNLKS